MNTYPVKQDRKIELLAPAGSKESFYAALGSGADAVYMAAQKFGARAYAGNFTYEEIMECAEIAHIYGKKIYLTVNTLVKEKELPELYEFIESGIPECSDGLIIQDPGVAAVFRKERPQIPLHASTQMSITGAFGAGILKKNGFCRVVPARELTFEEIRDIYDKTGMEIECFIHGAMCYSYSGQCLFSSVLGGRSGNRGRCAQPCRLPYRIQNSSKDTETYPLSLKDMCTLEILPQIIASGVCSLKVEGRMKPASYVAGVISIYRKYLDRIISGEEYRVEKDDLKLLSGLYVRGNLSHGYYDRRNSKDMVTVTSHGYNGSDENKGNNDLSFEKTLSPIGVEFNAVFKKGQKAFVTASCETVAGETAYGSSEGDVVEEALKSSIGREDICKALKKLGNTVFTTDDDHIFTDTDEGIFYSLKGIKQLRRDALEALKKNIIRIVNDSSDEPAVEDNQSNESVKIREKGVKVPESHCTIDTSDRNRIIYEGGKGSYSILISSKEQAEALVSVIEKDSFPGIARIYLDEGLLISSDDILNYFSDKIPLYAALSYIRRKGDDLTFIEDLLKKDKIRGLLIRNQEDLGRFSSEYADRIITDSGLYVFNAESSAFFDKYAALHTLPLELSYREAEDVIVKCNSVRERVVYGRAPLMITANCVRKTLRSCSHSGGFETIIDRKGISFPVKCDCLHCQNVIYNSVPLLTETDDMNDLVNRIEFTVENGREVSEVLKVYNGLKDTSEIKHTTGWLNRPVM